VSADRFVVVVKLLLGAVGVERRGRIVRGLFVRSTSSVWEELRERAEVACQAVRYLEVGGVGGVSEGQGQ
jgi:hypothetical protein